MKKTTLSVENIFFCFCEMSAHTYAGTMYTLCLLMVDLHTAERFYMISDNSADN